MIKLIATDIDGTLLGLDKLMPKNANNVIRKMIEKDILFVPASGRSYSSMENLFSPFIKDIAIIAENGGILDYKGEEFFSKIISKKLTENIVKFLEQENTFPIINSRNISYLLPRVLKIKDQILSYCTNLQEIKIVEDIQTDIVSVSIWVADGQVQEVYKLLTEKWTEDIIFVITGQYWIDAIPSGVNKGEALKLLMDKLNIKKEEVIAFGDYDNDIEMLELARLSYAMDHASDEVKSHAKNICKPSEILDIIEEIIS
ncbi:hypothetical protein AN643_00515 [Candidatus Epulonipiscioides saccharophilum]|nr:hypothetical protein AN643_00515 [Epulopiscium sp. SCG-B10WGA-EpuloB]